MKLYVSIAFFALAIVPSVRPQRIVTGPCPSVPAMGSFEKTKVLYL